MPQIKKDAHVLNIKLATAVYVKLEKFCYETGVSKTVATEKIMDLFFRDYFAREEDERTVFVWRNTPVL